MKHTRRIASLLLALVMVFAMATTAFADTATTGTITITNAVEGATYTAVKLFDATVNGDNIAYTGNIPDALSAYFIKDDAGNITVTDTGKDSTDSNKLSTAAIAAIKTWAASQTATATATVSKQSDDTYNAVFSNLAFGYYVINDNVGTVVTVDSTKPTATIAAKNEAPVLEKKVEEDSTNAYGDSNHADIGQVVNYQTTIQVKPGAKGYILYDNLSDGLTFSGSVTVKVGNNTITASSDTYTLTVANDTTTVSAPAGSLDANNTTACDFSISFADSWIASQVGNTITITYSATLNENAVVAGNGNPNETILKYGNEDKPLYTPEDTTTTYTFEFSVNKTDGANALAGAGFTLYSGETAMTVVKVTNTDTTKDYYKVVACNKTHAGENAECAVHTNEIVTGSTGKFEIEGLDAGTYVLKETTVPAGYNKAADVTVKIGDDDKVYTVTVGENDTTSETEATGKTITVVNQSGSELPSTGGMGTTLFYVVGGLLMAAAVVLLVTKKRMASAE